MKLHPNWSARENYAKSKKKRKKKDKVRDDGSNGKSKLVVPKRGVLKNMQGRVPYQFMNSGGNFWW